MHIKGPGNPFKSAKKSIEKAADSLEKSTSKALPGAGASDIHGKTLDHALKAARARKPGLGEMSNPVSAKELRRMDVHHDPAFNKLGAEDWWNRGDTIWQKEEDALKFAEVYEHASGKWGSITAQGSMNAASLRMRVYGEKSWDIFGTGNIEALIGVHGRFELVGAHYAALYKSPDVAHVAGHDLPINFNVLVDAFAGVEGYLEAGIRLGQTDNFIFIGAGGFAGASAAIKGTIDLDGLIGGEAMARGWAGAGAKAQLDVGVKGGKFGADVGIGAALGVGAEVDVGVVFDAAGLIALVSDVNQTYWSNDVYRQIRYALNHLPGPIPVPGQPPGTPPPGPQVLPPSGPQGPPQV